MLGEVGELDVVEANAIQQALHKVHPYKHNPVTNIQFKSVMDIQPNDYNPNAVAKMEMKLLHTSIKHDGYTQPTVTMYDEELQKYVIVDGFHRYYVMNNFSDIQNLNQGHLPIVMIDKDINDRMASTVRHNRARGKHSVTGMATIVMSMITNGATDEEVCNELGLEPDELIRLKYTTGVAKLFEDEKFSKVGKSQVQMGREYDPTNPNSQPIVDELIEKRFKNVVIEDE